MARILIFGDSISYGYYDFKKGGWTQRLKEVLDKKTSLESSYHSVYNLSISGETTEGILKRLEFEMKARLEEEGVFTVFAVGLNDSAFCHKTKSQWVSLDDYKENIRRLSEIASKFSSKIIFIGLTPVDEKRTNPTAWAPISYRNADIKKYNDSLRNFCKDNNIYFVEIIENLIKKDYIKFLEDGAHPNSRGHEKIFEIIKNYLIKNKII